MFTCFAQPPGQSSRSVPGNTLGRNCREKREEELLVSITSANSSINSSTTSGGSSGGSISKYLPREREKELLDSQVPHRQHLLDRNHQHKHKHKR